MVGTARWAASLDGIETALASNSFARAVIATDYPGLPVDIPGVILDLDEGPYHFGRRLAGILRRFDIDAAVYLGGGSLPLFSGHDFAALAERVSLGVAVTNNPYSSDMVGFPVTGVPGLCECVASCPRDNALARTLTHDAGLSVEALPRTVETQMDIDGPSDLTILSLTGRGGPRLRTYLGALDLDTEPYRRASELFTNPGAQVLVAGRVGSHAWQYLERETACRVRLFAEERGMEAEGRADAATARSLLGFHLEAVGTRRFFRELAELGDAAFLDTRVLLAHRGLALSRRDRFLSDARCWREVDDPFLREFTQAAVDAPIPVLLGGHSLTSGGIMALNEFVWSKGAQPAA